MTTLHLLAQVLLQLLTRALAPIPTRVLVVSTLLCAWFAATVATHEFDTWLHNFVAQHRGAPAEISEPDEPEDEVDDEGCGAAAADPPVVDEPERPAMPPPTGLRVPFVHGDFVDHWMGRRMYDFPEQ